MTLVGNKPRNKTTANILNQINKKFPNHSIYYRKTNSLSHGDKFSVQLKGSYGCFFYLKKAVDAPPAKRRKIVQSMINEIKQAKRNK